MLRKASFAAGLCLLACLVPSAAHAQDYGFQAKDLDFTLTGSGSNDKKFEAGCLGVSGSVGYFVTRDLEVSLRQTAAYSNASGPSSFTGNSRIAADYHFHLGRFTPFVGANIGYVYGQHINDTFEGAPEVGIKYFVNSTTYLFGLAEYEFFFRNGGQAGSGFKNGEFVYSVGIGFRVGQ